MAVVRTIAFTLILGFILVPTAQADPLLVDGIPLEQALSLPKDTGGERLNLIGSIYIGDLPKRAKKYDLQAPFGRLDRGEIGTYLAALISGKPVSGIATFQQALLLMNYAASGGGQEGKIASEINTVYRAVREAVKRDGRRSLWF